MSERALARASLTRTLHVAVLATALLVVLVARASTVALGSSLGPAATGDVVRASVSSAGVQANGATDVGTPVSPDEPLSADGRYVTFSSTASNLVASDTNGVGDVFLRDTQSGSTVRVSVGAGGAQANGRSLGPSISGDGRYVAFESTATTLVSGDTNAVSDVFVRDTVGGTTTRVSVATGGVQGNRASDSAAISADGRIVAYRSAATNLVSGDTNGYTDIFVHDLQTSATTRVSLASGSAQGLFDHWMPAVSADGRYVAFTSNSVNLVPEDKNRQTDVFVRDRVAATTSRASVTSTGGDPNAVSQRPSISADGRYVAFQSIATNLVPGDTNAVSDVFLRDRQAGTTRRVSTAASGAQGNAASQAAMVSGDGRYVAFDSQASNLGGSDTNGTWDVYVHDRHLNRMARGSVATTTGAQGNNASTGAALSNDGRYLLFRSSASNLVGGDTNGVVDAFVRNQGAPQFADLALTKTDAADPVDSNEDVTYTLTVSSVGTASTTGVAVSDPLPAGTSYVSSRASQGSCSFDGTKVVCQLGGLAAGASATATVVVRRATAGTITNTATVSMAEPDSNTANNSATETTTVRGNPDLRVTKTDARDPVALGANISYDIAVANAGDADATGTTLTDPLPEDTTFVSAEASQGTCSFDGTDITCALGTIAPAGSASATIVVRPTSSGTITNTASVSENETDRTPADNSDDETTTVDGPLPNLAIAKADLEDPVQTGSDITYRLTVSNLGTVDGELVTVSDAIPTSTTFVSAGSSQGACVFSGTVTCNLGTIASGGTATVTVVVASTTARTVTNTASVSSSRLDADSSDNSDTETTVVGTPDLALTKADRSDPVPLGQNITYDLAVVNNGDGPASGVTLSDPLPGTTTFVSASSSQGSGCSSDGTKVTCALGTLGPGASATATIVLSPTAQGTVTNTASVSSTEGDDDPSDDSDTEQTTIDPALPNLALTKTYWKPAVAVGETIPYKLTVTAKAPGAASGVTLVDPLPADTQFVSVTTGRGTCAFDGATVTCNIGTMAAGSAVNVFLTVKGTAEKMLTNTATVSSSRTDADSSDNTASLTTKVTRLSEYVDRTYQTNGPVEAVAYAGNVVYLGGTFTSVRPYGAAAGTGEVPRNNLAAFNATTGELLPWNPDANGTVHALVVSSNGSTVYVGGRFTTVRGLSRPRIAAISAVTGEPTAWDPNVWSWVRALALSADGSRIYVGGQFKTINGVERLRLAAIYTANRNLVPDFAPAIEYPTKPEIPYVTGLAVSPDGGSLYVGGVFETVAGQAHKSAAKIDLATGQPVAGWDADIEKKPNREESQVFDIVPHGSEVVLCGDFYQVQGKLSQNLAVVSAATGARREFPATDGAIVACAVSGDRLYLGGHYENVRPAPNTDPARLVPRMHLASIDVPSGQLSLWDPIANSIYGIYGLAATPTRLAVGGYFTKIGHWTNQTYFGQFSGDTT